jgi:(1->4)-alpha-D-glucan 1-alpha-D-glucosylmutase
MRVPLATYRLQLTDEFTLHDARDLVPYFVALGITDLYLSPVFEAPRGSTHGYDVTDPTRVRESLGGEAALRDLAETARAAGMGILLDIVPNHMAATPDNGWWRDVLQRGRHSSYARFFDIDWQNTGRVILPILGDEVDTLIERGEISLDPAAGELICAQMRLPLAAGSFEATTNDNTALRRALDRQHYQLAPWRTAAERMNYRRFFDIAGLVGVRVEDDAVFDATHALVRTLAADGVITGLRVDHIDGLRDPAGYLERLRAQVRDPAGVPLYTVVEKILERSESLPEAWACEGTTGYEFLNLATGMLIDPDGYIEIDRFYHRLTGDDRGFEELVREKKLDAMNRLFGGELTSLARHLGRIVDCGLADALLAVRETTASMTVYRTYIRSEHVRDDDRRRIEAALHDAVRHNPDAAPACALLRGVLLLEAGDVAANLDWIMRWQQFTGPVMAKGSEDTALYCHNALLAVNEVGSDPGQPSITTLELHAALARRTALSHRALNATATHDTKRGEDTRARIVVLSEIAAEWRRRLRRWIRKGDEWKAEVTDEEVSAVADADIDNLLYQALVGAWPLAGSDADFSDRIQQYMMKAVREAKEHTSWRRPDEDFEQALTAFVSGLMSDTRRAGLPEEIASFAHTLAPHGALNSLAQLVLKITAPGVPDFYQGTELWSYTLVDPDNRRPVDYETRRRLLEDVAPLVTCPEPVRVRTLIDSWRDGRLKLFVTAAALRCRARHAATFDSGGVLPLEAHGARADHVVAFRRSREADTIIVALPRWSTRLTSGAVFIEPGAWDDTVLALPGGAWWNTLTGERIVTDAAVPLQQLFATLPIALLEPAS